MERLRHVLECLRSPVRELALWSVLGLTCLSSSSCAEPHYERAADAAPAASGDRMQPASSDAVPSAQAGNSSTRDAAAADDATVAAVVPAWAAAALGQYAIRSRFFARGLGSSALNQLTNEWYWLSTVRFDAASAQVRMTSQLCTSAGTNTLAGVAVDVVVLYPASLNPHEYQLLSDGSEWYSQGDPALYGFTKTSQVSCTSPGALVSCSAEQQKWLSTGQCECPPGDGSLPIHLADCRIVDDDRDGEPGFTVRATGGVMQTYYARAVDDSEYIHGSFDDGGALAKAFYRQDEHTLQLGCNPEPCANSDSTNCDPGLNPVVLRRLSGPTDTATFDCADVTAMKASLFSTDPLTFPSGC